MENLIETLTIANASILDWTHRKTEKDGLKLHFTISAPLPKLLAKQLKCSGIYDMDTGRIDLLHKLTDTELVLPTPGVEGSKCSFFPDVAYKFKALRDEQQFTLQFSIHISTRCEEMHESLKHAPELFDMIIRPRQGQLFEGGTRVDIAPKKAETEPDTGCIACNNGIPLAGGRPGWHDSGVACTLAAADHPDAAPLAPAATMGGTHQKRSPRANKSTSTVN